MSRLARELDVGDFYDIFGNIYYKNNEMPPRDGCPWEVGAGIAFNNLLEKGDFPEIDFNVSKVVFEDYWSGIGHAKYIGNLLFLFGFAYAADGHSVVFCLYVDPDKKVQGYVPNVKMGAKFDSSKLAKQVAKDITAIKIEEEKHIEEVTIRTSEDMTETEEKWLHRWHIKSVCPNCGHDEETGWIGGEEFDMNCEPDFTTPTGRFASLYLCEGCGQAWSIRYDEETKKEILHIEEDECF